MFVLGSLVVRIKGGCYCNLAFSGSKQLDSVSWDRGGGSSLSSASMERLWRGWVWGLGAEKRQQPWRMRELARRG